MFKLLILDIDGVLTDGRKAYDLNGDVIHKTFNDKDFTAIKRFIHRNVQVCLLSADDRVNRAIAKSRKLKFYYTRELHVNDKEELLNFIKKSYSVSENEIIYVGDDIPDLNIITRLTHTYCPSDAVLSIKQAAKEVLNSKGGAGVIAELYENIYNE
tara:strand:- start:35 stop:502 length:468 start_codon:yes stop_codon:yes gene_type:complete